MVCGGGVVVCGGVWRGVEVVLWCVEACVGGVVVCGGVWRRVVGCSGVWRCVVVCVCVWRAKWIVCFDIDSVGFNFPNIHKLYVIFFLAPFLFFLDNVFLIR